MRDPSEKLSGLLNKKDTRRVGVLCGEWLLVCLIIKPQMKLHVSHISKSWIFHLAVGI